MLTLSLQVDRRKGFLSAVEQVSIKAELRAVSPSNAGPTIGEDAIVPYGDHHGDQSGRSIPIPLFIEKLLARFPEAIPYLRAAPEDSDINETTVIDLRGRPPETLPVEDQTSLLFREVGETTARAEEELFYSQGTIFQPLPLNGAEAKDEDGEDDEGSIEPESIPFFFRIVSRFDSFKGDSHIVHRVIPRASGVLHQLLPHLSGRLMTRMVPLELDKVRLGLESYKAAGLGSLLGRAPVVQSRLYLEVTKDTITIEAHREGSKRGENIPFAEQALLAGIDATLRDCGLYRDLSDKISEKLQQKSR